MRTMNHTKYCSTEFNTELVSGVFVVIIAVVTRVSFEPEICSFAI